LICLKISFKKNPLNRGLGYFKKKLIII